MKYQRAKSSFFRTKDAHLAVQAKAILHGLEDETIFPSPSPTLPELKTAIVDYEDKLHKALSGSLLQREAKRESKKRLAILLQQLAFYVNRIADGDLTILYRSGFPVFTGRKKGLNPDTPGLPVLKDSILSGEAVLSFQPVGRDMIYEYNVADHIDSGTKEPAWGEMRYTTRSFKNIIKGYSTGQCIWVRVRARNKHGASDWTESVKWMIR